MKIYTKDLVRGELYWLVDPDGGWGNIAVYEGKASLFEVNPPPRTHYFKLFGGGILHLKSHDVSKYASLASESDRAHAQSLTPTPIPPKNKRYISK